MNFLSIWKRCCLLFVVILARGIEGRKCRAKCCPPWWLLFLCVFVGLALAQWSTAFKWATRECLNGEAGGVLESVCARVCVCVFVEGVGVRQQECVMMQGLLSLIRWAQLGWSTFTFKPLSRVEVYILPSPHIICDAVNLRLSFLAVWFISLVAQT